MHKLIFLLILEIFLYKTFKASSDLELEVMVPLSVNARFGSNSIVANVIKKNCNSSYVKTLESFIDLQFAKPRKKIIKVCKILTTILISALFLDLFSISVHKKFFVPKTPLFTKEPSRVFDELEESQQTKFADPFQSQIKEELFEPVLVKIPASPLLLFTNPGSVQADFVPTRKDRFFILEGLLTHGFVYYQIISLIFDKIFTPNCYELDSYKAIVDHIKSGKTIELPNEPSLKKLVGLIWIAQEHIPNNLKISIILFIESVFKKIDKSKKDLITFSLGEFSTTI